MTGKKGLKLLLWIAVAVVVLILAAYAAVAILLPKDKIIAMVVPKVEEALNRKVSVGDVSVSIWGGIGLKLSELAVENPGGFKTTNFMELADLDVKVRLFPLFKKRIEITEILLNGLRVNLERTETGLTNFSDIGAASGAQEAEPVEPEKAAAALPFTFEDLRLSNSTVNFTDDSSGFKVVLEGIELSSELVPADRPEVLSSRGELKINDFSYSDLGQEYSLPSIKIGVSYDLTYDMKGDSIGIGNLAFALSELKGKAVGVVRQVSGETLLDLSFRTDDLDVEDALSAVPRELLPQADDLVGSGKFHMVAEYRGPAELTSTADVEGKLTIKDVELAHKDFKGTLKVKLAELNFSESSLTFFTDNAELSGEPFSLKVILDDISDPNLSAEAKIEMNLKAVKQFLDPGDEISGRLKLDASAYGKLEKPESMSLLGSLKFKDIRYSTPELTYSVDDATGEFEFLGKDLRIETFKADLGGSDINITGQVKNLTPYLFAPTGVKRKPLFLGRVTSNFLDLDELYGEEDETSDVAGGGQVDTAVFVLPDFDAEGTFHLASGIYSLVAFENATGKFVLTDYVLHLDSVTATVYDGDVTGSAVVDIEDFERPEFRIDYNAKEIEVDGFLSRFTNFSGHFFGEIDMMGSFSGAGSEIEDLLPTLAGAGFCKMRNGELVNFELVKKLAEPLGYKTFDKEAVRNLAGSFRVENGRVGFDDLDLTTSAGEWQLSGSVGFDGSLDYSGKVALSADAAKNLDFLGDFKALFKDSGGKVVLPFKLSGTYSTPQIELDTSPLKENVDNKLKDEGKKLLDKLFKD